MHTLVPWVICLVPSLADSQNTAKQALRNPLELGKQAMENIIDGYMRTQCCPDIKHSKKSYVKLLELHEKYGPVVRLGPKYISVSDKDMVKQILVKDDLMKGPNYGFLDSKSATNI